MTPARMSFLASIGGAEFFSPDIAKRIRTEMSINAMTPIVVRNYVDDLFSRRQRYLEDLDTAHRGLTALGVVTTTPAQGSPEVAFLIPRQLFENELGALGEELQTINKIIRFFSEAANGSPETVIVRQISTSDPTFTFGLLCGTAVLLAKAANWLLDAWKKLEEIKKLRAETKKIGFDENDLKAFFDDKAAKVIGDEIDRRSREIVESVDGAGGRRAELENGIRWALNSLMARFERGMILEIRLLPPVPPEGATDGSEKSEEVQMATELHALSQMLNFDIPVGAPILELPPPEPNPPAPPNS